MKIIALVMVLFGGTAFADYHTIRQCRTINGKEVCKNYKRAKPPRDLEGVEYATRKCEYVQGRKICSDWDSSVDSSTHQLGKRVEEIPRKRKRRPRAKPQIIRVPGKEVKVYRPFFLGGALGRGLGSIRYKEHDNKARVAEKEEWTYQIMGGWRFTYNWSVYGVYEPESEKILAGGLWSFGELRVR